MEYQSKNINGLLLGHIVGDAMGVPFEFMESEELENESFENMKGYGSHNQPKGSFSDDSSLILCTVEGLIYNYNQYELANLFIKWRDEFYWTANNLTFDIGITTNSALENIKKGILIEHAAPSDELSCGNGALMRVLPLVFYCHNKTLDEIYALVVKYATITHGHIRSHMSCFYLVLYAFRLLQFKSAPKKQLSLNKQICFAHVSREVEIFFESREEFKAEKIHFERLFNCLPHRLNDLENSGYVIHSLEVVLACFMKYNRYENIVIAAIKYGGDTDTNACIVGGLAGLYYGDVNIPLKWLDDLLRKDDIMELAIQWGNKIVCNLD